MPDSPRHFMRNRQVLVRVLSLIRAALKKLGLLPLIKRVLHAPDRDPRKAVGSTGFHCRLKTLIEQANFAAVAEVHDLPAIHAR